nr:acyltransferase family protein [Lachnospiraceae bacterium]
YGIMGAIVICCSIIPYIILLFTSLEEYGRILWGIYLFYYCSGYFFHLPHGRSGKKETAGEGRTSGKENLQEKPTGKPGDSGKRMLMAAAVILLMVGGSRLLICHRLLWRDYAYPPVVIVTLLIFIGVRQCFKDHRGEKLRGLSELCFGVYLIHPVFLNIIFKGGMVPGGGHLLLLWGVLIYMAALLGAGAVTRLLRKVPFMRRYVL